MLLPEREKGGECRDQNIIRDDDDEVKVCLNDQMQPRFNARSNIFFFQFEMSRQAIHGVGREKIYGRLVPF